MKTYLTKKDDCSGCGACRNICPCGAVTMLQDFEGFLYPHIDGNICIQCGRCKEVCPGLNPPGTGNCAEPEVYAAWSDNMDIRLNSTSGGIFSEFALKILDRSGYICGAIYNDENMVEHYITSSKDGLYKIRQSKYVQSDMKEVYADLAQKLVEGHEVLFCGSPCECAAVYNYMKTMECDAERLILIDFVCRGANSPKVYRMFLDELEREYNSKVTRVWFKNKTYGWNRFSTKIEFENGQYYLEDRAHDSYIRGYIEKDLYMRPSCTACKFKGFPRVSDITLADFWGIRLEDGTRDTDKGTSMVVINSEKGEKMFSEIKPHIFFEKKTLNEASKGNFCMYNSVPFGMHRAEFMESLDKMSVIDNIKRFL